MQLFDLVLHVPAAAIDSIYPFRIERDVGHDIACIVSRVSSRETYHLCFDHNPAGFVPGLGPILKFREYGFGLVADDGKGTHHIHYFLGLGDKNGVGSITHDIFNAFLVQIIKDIWRAETAIEAHADPGFRERRAYSRNDPGKNADGATRAMSIARAKNRREEVLLVFAVELQCADHGEIAEAVVMRVEEGELLGAMGWIVGGIQIDRDAAGPVFQSAGMMFDDDIGQTFGHCKQIFGRDRVLET